ncbi:DUF4231 domain-containing protein [Nostoc sp. FACHB-87]|uniref:DUF4231 domain-containing protein n=1 Tax=Nostocaceae TaxID=1162 RepID=UPI0016861513|nr:MULTISPECIES: SLATT domain-containing protein [Nostocaceae]MBD2437514.1 DUF4231 domain-containing protein [Nostoc sp. FACHB-110]MBD2454429.1 DUF4231 domain-containing protein [Nostoc sp. FACHB-87]MBD2474385.1 DUF4231 domain-containing protein [Anabaena sp. FACHB-83]
MSTNLNGIPQTVIFLEQVAKNSRLNKHQHFNAAERNLFYNNIFGSAAIVINVILGSVLFVTVSSNLPEFAKWASGFMAMIAAVCGGIQTFFNFQKLFEGHRRIANNYLELQRECEQLLAAFSDQLINLEQVVKEVEVINKKYNTINSDAEVFPTGDKDYRKAKRYEKEKHLA